MLGDRDGILNGDVAGDMSAKVSCGTSDATFTMPEKHPTKVPMLQLLLEKNSSDNFQQESTVPVHPHLNTHQYRRNIYIFERHRTTLNIHCNGPNIWKIPSSRAPSCLFGFDLSKRKQCAATVRQVLIVYESTAMY